MPEQQINHPIINENLESPLDLHELLFHLLDKWKAIISTSVLCAILSGIITIFCITPMYQSTSTIYVLSRKDSAIDMSDLQIGSALTSDYLQVFDMWEVHEQVLSNLDLPYSYKEIRKMLSVVNIDDTRMLDITVTSSSASEAALIANEYAEVASQYIADTMSTDKPNIMSVALESPTPVSPDKIQNIVLGFMLGFVLSAGIVTSHAITNDRFKTAEEIRKYTGFNTLAIIPIDEDACGKTAKKSRRSL